jgi:hypothetical protein
MPSQDFEVQRAVGRLEGNVKGLSDDMAEIALDLKESIQQNQKLLYKLDRLEAKVDPLADSHSKHEDRILKLENFDNKLMAVVALASLTISSLAGGMWVLIVHFSDVLTFIRKMFTGP